MRHPPISTLFPYTTLFRSWRDLLASALEAVVELERPGRPVGFASAGLTDVGRLREQNQDSFGMIEFTQRSEEHTSELQSQFHLVCRLLLEKKKSSKSAARC